MEKREEMANSKTKVGRVQAELIIKLEHLIKLESKEEPKKKRKKKVVTHQKDTGTRLKAHPVLFMASIKINTDSKFNPCIKY